MSWTYNPTLPTDKDIVRFMVGDTISADPLVEDEEILATLSMQPVVQLASAEIAEAIAGKFARCVDTKVGKSELKKSQRAQFYLDLSKRIKEQYRRKGAFTGIPYAGGISKSDKCTVEQNSDRVEPIFKKGQMDNKSGCMSDPNDNNNNGCDC
jgi:hypothetical protein